MNKHRNCMSIEKLSADQFAEFNHGSMNASNRVGKCFSSLFNYLLAMTNSKKKRKYFFISTILILLCFQSISASATTATIVSVPTFTVSHPNLHGGSPTIAGLILITIDGSSTEYRTYCLQLGIFTSIGNSYVPGSTYDKPSVQWILSNYYPNTLEPSGLSSADAKAAAIQLAIWHFTSDLDISSPGNDHPDVFNAARDIISAASSHSSLPPSPIPTILDLAPQSATNQIGSPHTATATITDQNVAPLSGETIQFEVTGANPTNANSVTNSNGQAELTYSGTNLGIDAIKATVSFSIPVGLRWIGANPLNTQELIMADTAPGSLVKTATKTWRGPVITSVTSSSPCTNNEPGDVVVTAHVNDNVDVNSVTLDYDGATPVVMTLSGPPQNGDWTGNIPVQSAGTTVTYHVTAVDADNFATTSPAKSIKWIDCGAPQIVSIQPLTACSGHDAVVEAHITASQVVSSATLVYGTAPVTTTIPMVLQSGTDQDGIWTATILSQPAGTVLPIHVSATDKATTPNTVTSDSTLTWQNCIVLIVTPGTITPTVVCLGGLGKEILAHVEDAAGVTSVTLNYLDQNGAPQTVFMSRISGTAENGDWSARIPDQPVGTITKYKVTALDATSSITEPADQNTYFQLLWKNCKSGLELKKTVQNAVVHRGESINYTIKVCNNGLVPLTNIIMWDILPKSVELLYVSLDSSNLQWNIGTLNPGECFEVDLRARVPIVNIHYDMSQDVQGIGFANVHTDYNTHLGPESVVNCAYARADLVNTISSCANVDIVDPGTELKKREFGSGSYLSEELTKIRTENKSINTTTSLSAIYNPTTFSLPKGRSIRYGAKWTEKSKGINTLTGATMNEEYTFANKIKDDRSIELDENSSTMKSDVEFEGAGHIGVLKKESPDDHPRVKPAFESTEDFVGAFKVYEYVDEYGCNVRSNKSVTGIGYVAVDKRVRDSQRTYESGTGSYTSDEIVDTPTNYIAKNLSLIYAPITYSYSPTFNVNQSMKWSEGMLSKSGALRGGDIVDAQGSFGFPANTASCSGDNGSSSAFIISEKYSYLDYLKKNTVMSGLNEMKTNANFSGTADYRVKALGPSRTRKVEDEERYTGKYNINRKVVLTGVSKYDRPHITVTKEGKTISEWYNNTNAEVADYVITITNDGNSDLAPVYVRDFFPPGTSYIKSSIRPSRISSTDANWTLLYLGIGNTLKINLQLNVTEDRPNSLVNRVMVCGVQGGSWVCAANYSAIEFAWLPCCPPKVSVEKTAKLDSADPTIVHYTITVKNNAKVIMAATLTDSLPAYMSLLQSSIEPNSYTYDNGFIKWVLPELAPDKVESIEYAVRATRDGTYVNTVHVDASGLNGGGYDDTANAAAYINIRGTGAPPRTSRYGGDWQPPNWNLTSPDEGLSIDYVPELTLLTADGEQ